MCVEMDVGGGGKVMAAVVELAWSNFRGGRGMW
jgi:hypothetical protein